MDTVNSIASSASKAIWGDNTNTTQSNETGGQEPVSGETGNTKAGEPFDAGNAGDNTGASTTGKFLIFSRVISASRLMTYNGISRN